MPSDTVPLDELRKTAARLHVYPMEHILEAMIEKTGMWTFIYVWKLM